MDILISQIKDINLNIYERVIGLGGKEYRAMMEAAFSHYDIIPSFPFSGLPIGKAMAAIKEAIMSE